MSKSTSTTSNPASAVSASAPAMAAPTSSGSIEDWVKSIPEAPEGGGFIDETTPELEGWWDVESKVPIWGVIMGAFEQEGDDGSVRDTVIVKIKYPTMAIPAGQRGDDAKAQKFEAGALIGIGIRHKIREILNYVEHRGEVYVKPEQQKRIGGGRRMWEFTVRCKGKKAPPPFRQRNPDNTSPVPF
jgi:hypothetical protein